MRFNLIKFRRKKRLSQKKMAILLGISRPHYSDIENGKVSPSIDFAYKVKEVFNIDDVMELLKKE